MAEFQEVMRQITRYCNSQNGCASCKLSKITDDHCPSDLFADDNGANIENEVMSWTAEHPVVYPTWADYISALIIKDICTGKISGPDTVLTYAMKTHIPEDIAEKLGIEPKNNS